MDETIQPLSRSLSRLPMIQPLDQAHNYLLQVLITRFRMVRQAKGLGTRLEVRFDRSTPCIWNRHGKSALLKQIPDFARKSEKYQKELDGFLIEGRGKSYDFNDDSFPFRYVSGGTLPIVKMDGKQYYCLFYREIEPIGWNIANGAADNLHELIDPSDTVRREFGEELLIVNPRKKERYVFEWATGELVEWPGYSVARRLFQKHYPDLNLGECREVTLRLEWQDGPDSLLVSCEGEEPRLITGFFLNVNATDFGIEIDRIAEMTVDGSVVFDGEISGDVPVGAPIGLFPVETFNDALRRGDTSFKPSRFFYDARHCDTSGDDLEQTIENIYVPRLLRTKVLDREEASQWRAANRAGKAYDLCPVTRSLVQRYLRKRRIPAPSTHYDFFLSWAQPDENLAKQVYRYLTQKMQLRVFFSAETPMDARFGDAIRAALRDSDGLIVVATRPQYLTRVGVMYEWVTFINHIDDGRKPKDTPLINFAGGITYDELPTQLSLYHLINFNPYKLGPGLQALGDYIRRLRDRPARGGE